MNKQIRIMATQLGFDDGMSIEQIYGLLQDAITEALWEMGCDNITLRRDYHDMWVFNKHRVRVYRRPVWGETVNIHCRVVKSSRLACWFATDVTALSGEPLVQGLLECCVLDIESFRFVKLETIPFVPASEETEPYTIPFSEPTEHISDFTVVPSLTDMSGHMNNAKGLRPLEDSFTRDELKQLFSAPFEVNIRYVSQAMYGTALQLWRGRDPNRLSFAYRREDGSDVFSGCVSRL